MNNLLTLQHKWYQGERQKFPSMICVGLGHDWSPSEIWREFPQIMKEMCRTWKGRRGNVLRRLMLWRSWKSTSYMISIYRINLPIYHHFLKASKHQLHLHMWSSFSKNTQAPCNYVSQWSSLFQETIQVSHPFLTSFSFICDHYFLKTMQLYLSLLYYINCIYHHCLRKPSKLAIPPWQLRLVSNNFPLGDFFDKPC